MILPPAFDAESDNIPLPLPPRPDSRGQALGIALLRRIVARVPLRTGGHEQQTRVTFQDHLVAIDEQRIGTLLNADSIAYSTDPPSYEFSLLSLAHGVHEVTRWRYGLLDDQYPLDTIHLDTTKNATVALLTTLIPEPDALANAEDPRAELRAIERLLNDMMTTDA